MTRQPAQSFDAFAETYDRLVSLSTGSVRSFVESVLPEAGHRAADLGCGTGHHASILASRFEDVLAVDISRPMLEIARTRRASPHISYELRDLRDVIPEKDGRFDLVFSAFTLHHVPELDEALQRIRSLLALGGRVVRLDNVASTPAVPRWWFRREAFSAASSATCGGGGVRCARRSRCSGCRPTRHGSTTSRPTGFSARQSFGAATAPSSPAGSSPISTGPAP